MSVWHEVPEGSGFDLMYERLLASGWAAPIWSGTRHGTYRSDFLQLKEFLQGSGFRQPQGAPRRLHLWYAHRCATMNLSVLSIGILCAALQASTPVEDAFQLAWKGDLAEARREVESILATSPNDLGALIVSVCVSLESGRLDEASRTVERLLHLTPTPAATTALKAADDALRNPLFANLEILSLLRLEKNDSTELYAKKRRAAQRVGAAVAAADPENGYLATAAALAGEAPDTPLDSATLAKLEAAVALPRFEYPRRTVRTEMAASARRADPSRGDLRAAAAALGSPVDAVVTLWQRAEATNDPSARARATRVLAAAGDGFESSHVLLERMLAVTLQTKAALLSGDSDRIARAQAKRKSVQTWGDELRAITERLGHWPLVSIWREWNADDEIPYMERLRE